MHIWKINPVMLDPMDLKINKATIFSSAQIPVSTIQLGEDDNWYLFLMDIPLPASKFASDFGNFNSYTPLSVKICFLLWKFQLKIFIIFKISEKKFQNLEFFSKISKTTKGPPMTSKGPPPPY